MVFRQVTAARVVSAACAALALSVSTPATASTPASAPVKVGDVQKAMEALVKSGKVVGAIGEVYVDGKRAGKGSAGSRLIDGNGDKIPSTARYRIGSQTKQMTATVVMQLVQSGKLKLNDKLGKLLPEVAKKGLIEQADEITVQSLVQHTSGILDAENPDVDPLDTTVTYRPMDLLAVTGTGKIGTVAYANTNYILLGMIIEKLTGHSLASELKKRIFTPLGMRDTYLPVKGSEGIKGPHGHGYTVNEKGAVVDVDKMNATAQLGAGGVISTAHDMSAFKRAFTQNKLLPASLTTVITTIPGAPPITGGGPCKGNPEFGPRNDGSAPGYVSTTFASSDGRIQFAVSMTLAMNDDERLAAGRPLGDALTSVFCPAA